MADELLTLVASALHVAGAQSWAVPRPWPDLPSLGVRDSQRGLVARALGGLADADRSVGRLRDLPTRTPLTTQATTALAREAAVLRVIYEDGLPVTDLGHPATYVDVEFWRDDSDVLRGPRRTAFGATLPDRGEPPTWPLRSPGLRSTLLTYPEFAARAVQTVDFGVDVVYSWVDSSDSAWRSALRRADRRAAAHLEDAAPLRFRSRDELRYSLRALDDFAPWVRSVYLVTAGHVPRWLQTSSRVQVVTHTDILEPECLPTFNSHAIEAALHRIPGLSEHFLYFNDDVVLLTRAWPEDYFEGNGTPRFFMSPQYYSFEPGDPPGYKAAAQRGKQFLQRTYGVTPTRYLRHTPHAHRVSTLEQFERQHPAVFTATRAAQFRGQGDYNLIASLAHYYAYIHARAVPAETDAALVYTSSPDAVARLSRLYRERVRSVCLNDDEDHGSAGGGAWAELQALLDDILPYPSSAESAL